MIDERITIKLIGAGMYSVQCEGVGVIVPWWRITEKLIWRVVRMHNDIAGIGR